MIRQHHERRESSDLEFIGPSIRKKRKGKEPVVKPSSAVEVVSFPDVNIPLIISKSFEGVTLVEPLVGVPIFKGRDKVVTLSDEESDRLPMIDIVNEEVIEKINDFPLKRRSERNKLPAWGSSRSNIKSDSLTHG